MDIFNVNVNVTYGRKNIDNDQATTEKYTTPRQRLRNSSCHVNRFFVVRDTNELYMGVTRFASRPRYSRMIQNKSGHVIQLFP